MYFFFFVKYCMSEILHYIIKIRIKISKGKVKKEEITEKILLQKTEVSSMNDTLCIHYLLLRIQTSSTLCSFNVIKM